jgi:hypothetical protein
MWLWGFPAICLIVAWRRNIFRGRTVTDGLWRLYRHTQLAALLLPLVIMLAYLMLFRHLTRF